MTKFIHCKYVCVPVNQYVECFVIMRWWISNLGQWPLQNLGSVTYCYVSILELTHPLLLLSDLLPGGGCPLLPRHSLLLSPACLRTGSSAHPGVTCLCSNIPILLCISLAHFCQYPPPSYPLLPPPRLLDSCCRRSSKYVSGYFI